MDSNYVLAFSCPRGQSVVQKVSSEIASLGGEILDAQQYDDPAAYRFFSRMKISVSESAADRLRERFRPVMEQLEAEWVLRSFSQRKRLLVMASQHGHCLSDIIFRQRTGDLKVDIVGVVSNHPMSVHDSIDFGEIPYFHLPISADTKREQEKKLLGLVKELSVDLVVLARYMQVLSDELASELAGRCINIHHSFLPGFKGARPYHQAYERGVKLIGATAHYVTGDLDEGPIIAQSVEPTHHRDTPRSLARKGRDVERRVLATAVHHAADDRVFMNGRTTVVFPE